MNALLFARLGREASSVNDKKVSGHGGQTKPRFFEEEAPMPSHEFWIRWVSGLLGREPFLIPGKILMPQLDDILQSRGQARHIDGTVTVTEDHLNPPLNNAPRRMFGGHVKGAVCRIAFGALLPRVPHNCDLLPRNTRHHFKRPIGEGQLRFRVELVDVRELPPQLPIGPVDIHVFLLSGDKCVGFSEFSFDVVRSETSHNCLSQRTEAWWHSQPTELYRPALVTYPGLTGVDAPCGGYCRPDTGSLEAVADAMAGMCTHQFSGLTVPEWFTTRQLTYRYVDPTWTGRAAMTTWTAKVIERERQFAETIVYLYDPGQRLVATAVATQFFMPDR